MNAVTYWSAQQSYRLKLAESRAIAAWNIAMTSDVSAPDATTGTTSRVSAVSASSPSATTPVSVSSLELLHYRPNELLVMPTKPSVPQVI